MTDYNYFEELNNIDCTGKIEQKNGLTYLSWAYAWAEVKKLHPTATYKIYENKDQWNYFTDGKTCWVKTGVTIDFIEHIEYLPVMDYRNKSIPLDSVTSFDVNKAIQRSLTKALARHGLGLYIYAGEDLPEQKQDEQKLDEKTRGEKAKETREKNKAEFERRFAKMYEYFTNSPEWSYYVDQQYHNLIKEATEKKYELEKCEEMKKIFDGLEKDSLPEWA